jgi:hypothetical protein
MKADEFSVWFSGVRRLSAGQRRELAAALANLDGGLGRAGETKASAAGGATDKGAKRGCRPDALGMSGHERVASQGCPHCAGRAIVAWGRSHGLSRFRCRSCGRTWRRHQEPAQLSRPAARPRSLGRSSHAANLDQGRNRKRPISTGTAIGAKNSFPLSQGAQRLKPLPLSCSTSAPPARTDEYKHMSVADDMSDLGSA